MYDACQVYVNTADANAAINFPCVVHRVEVEHADGTAALSVQLHNAATVAGTALCSVTTNLADGTTFQRQAGVEYPNGVLFDKAISANITGTGTYRIYYTRR
jgi:hypothetical protein